MVTGAVVPALAEPPPAAWLDPEPAVADDEPPLELQAARVGPAAQHASAIATRRPDRPRTRLPWVLLFNSLTVPSCFLALSSGLSGAPLGDAAFGPPQQGGHHDRGQGEDRDSDEDLAGLEVLAGGDDQAADAAVAEEVLGDDDADQGAADREAHPGHEVGDQGGEQDRPDDRQLAAAEAAGEADQFLVHVPGAGDDAYQHREDGDQDHHHDLGAEADAA